jgi:hypothetical protein
MLSRYAMQAPRGRGLLLLILDLGTRWGTGHCHVPAALYPRGKEPCHHCTGGWMGLVAK